MEKPRPVELWTALLVTIPIVVIGGINKQMVPNYKEKGIDGVAVVSAIVSQPDVKAAVKEMWKLNVSFRRLSGNCYTNPIWAKAFGSMP